MIYLDYSATTPPFDEVVDSFVKVSKNCFANPNSNHQIGFKANKLIIEATEQIASILHIKETEIIYTSGASEANNQVIKSFLSSKKKTIITTKYEHPSIIEPIKYMTKNGFKIKYVNLLKNGLVDLNHLKKLIDHEVILVSIGAVNSELGIRQPIEQIGQILKNENILFHSDFSQIIGKQKISFDFVDYATFSGHKFFSLKGIGILYHKEKTNLNPLIDGGHSFTKYRAGTPTTELIIAIAKSLRLMYSNLEQNIEKVNNLNIFLKEELKKIKEIRINSDQACIPHIVNISVMGIKSATIVNALSEKEIYLSSQTACSKNKQSELIYYLTKDQKRAESSIRISLSHITTKKEIKEFINQLKQIINK